MNTPMSAMIIHAILALIAALSGSVVLYHKKGTVRHKKYGWIFVISLLVSSLLAIPIQWVMPGHYSISHLFIPATLLGLGTSIAAIKIFQKTGHRFFKYVHVSIMIILYCATIVFAGTFTLAPTRLMHNLLFGTQYMPPRPIQSTKTSS